MATLKYLEQSCEFRSNGFSNSRAMIVLLALFPLLVVGIGLLMFNYIQRPVSKSQLNDTQDAKLIINEKPGNKKWIISDKNHISGGDEVWLLGIDLPITNKICNKKGTFCIDDLASLMKSESGEARYAFHETCTKTEMLAGECEGKEVSINGSITIHQIQRSEEGKTVLFNWRDDLSATTSGWAGAGKFRLDQNKDLKKPGIMAKFLVSESFGDKSPVGLENTSYLFPR